MEVEVLLDRAQEAVNNNCFEFCFCKTFSFFDLLKLLEMLSNLDFEKNYKKCLQGYNNYYTIYERVPNAPEVFDA